MKGFLPFLFSLFISAAQAGMIYPGQTTDITFEPTTGEYGPIWTTDNPTLHLSSIGFLCHVTAQAYFGGTATVTCSYKDQIGSTTYNRTRRWTFTCADTKISVSPTNKILKVGESVQLTWSFSNATHINPSIQFTGYDNAVISVSKNGEVTAKSEGTTQVYVKSNLGTNSAICTVRVRSELNSESAIFPYDNWDSSNTLTINLREAGTLGNYITESNKYAIENLTLIGLLNGADLRLLRDMAGTDCNNKPTNGKLRILDLKEAIFVSGGPWYLNGWENVYNYTEDNNILPQNSFRWCKNIAKLRFPKYCTVISNGGTLHCDKLEELAIPPGTTEIDYSCLTGGWDDFAMTSLSIPSSIEKFNADIYKCGNLTDMHCYAINPPVIKYPNSFINQTNISNGTLYVPKGSAQAYWEAEGWRAFKDIKEVLDVYNTLSISVGENGCVKYNDVEIKQKFGISYSGYQAFEVLSGSNVEIELIPNERYHVSNIFINNQPQPIPIDNHLLFGSLSSHTMLCVHFEDSASTEDIFDNKMSPRLSVYNLQGVMIANNVTTESLNSLPHGLYIIKSGTKTYKYHSNK